MVRWFKEQHPRARWAALTAFFGNLVVVKVLDILTHQDLAVQVLSALVTALIVGLAVYSRERWEEAKKPPGKEP